LLLLILNSLSENDANGFIRNDIIDNGSDDNSPVNENCVIQMLSDWNTGWVSKSYKTTSGIDIDTCIPDGWVQF